MSDSLRIRPLSSNDLPLVQRLLNTSEFIYQRFTLEELPMLLRHYPAVGMFNGDSMNAFLLSQTVNPPSAWIGGFGVSWTESREYISILEKLLEQLTKYFIKRGVRSLYYSGNDMQRDWLRDVLLARKFTLHRLLYSYDKHNYNVPSTGNLDVTLRPVEKRDIPALLVIEEACFEDFWRYDALSFEDIASTHPYFVVAELNGKIVGYQFNALEDEFGYLVRIAVHPSASGQGVGVRLMSAAIAFFQQAHVLRIMLNTQDDNVRAHKLYEWFGFVRIMQMGFVLRKSL
jgi:[ribosomal protein S18]-alanine N-acetyltransferase